jgi:putative ABC transport system substrate-binding protein
MRRRDFIKASSVLAAYWPLAAHTQPTQISRVGALILGNADAEAFAKEMRQGLSKSGYVEGRNVLFDIRSAQGRLELLPELAQQLVAAKVDVLVALYTPCARAAQRATRDIPIVAIVANPVETGIIESLSRPGGNITGVSLMAAEAHGKCVEVFSEMLPSVRKVAALEIVERTVRSADEIEQALESAAKSARARWSCKAACRAASWRNLR